MVWDPASKIIGAEFPYKETKKYFFFVCGVEKIYEYRGIPIAGLT